MKHAGRLTLVTAMAAAVLAMTGGVAGATLAPGSGPSASGSVTAVNGDSTSGVCGTTGATGSFTLTSHGDVNVTVHTINVTSSTSFVEKAVATPSFANVCVGDNASAIGNGTNFVIDAAAVSISVPKHTHAFGTVTAVGGVSTSGTCGTANASGSFTLSTLISDVHVITTVFVTPDTKFNVSHVGTANFAGVCVGNYAQAEGLADSSAVLATSVEVKIPKPHKPLHVSGAVTLVGGVATAGTCGVSGTAGNFVVTWTDKLNTVHNITVVVTASTQLFARGAVAATFANVCVGGKASVIGTNSSGALNAVAVAAYAPKI
jgi:hypothetical protein